jgi:hypothetical protein
MPGILYQDAFHTRGRKCIAHENWHGQYTVCESRCEYTYSLSVYCGKSEAIKDFVVCLLGDELKMHETWSFHMFVMK